MWPMGHGAGLLLRSFAHLDPSISALQAGIMQLIWYDVKHNESKIQRKNTLPIMQTSIEFEPITDRCGCTTTICSAKRFREPLNPSESVRGLSHWFFDVDSKLTPSRLPLLALRCLSCTCHAATPCISSSTSFPHRQRVGLPAMAPHDTFKIVQNENRK